MTDLHTRLVEAITARLNLAEAALAERESDWWWGPDAELAAERHIAANHPGQVIRACRADLELLEQHRLVDDHEDGDYMYCAGCRGYDPPWPCGIVRNRAGVYGVNLDEQSEV